MKCIVWKIKIKVQYGIILLPANLLNLHLKFAPYNILNFILLKGVQPLEMYKI